MLMQNVIEFYKGLVMCSNLGVLLVFLPFAALSSFNSLMSDSQLMEMLRSHVHMK